MNTTPKLYNETGGGLSVGAVPTERAGYGPETIDHVDQHEKQNEDRQEHLKV